MTQRTPVLEGTLSVATAFLLMLLCHALWVGTMNAEIATPVCGDYHRLECERSRSAVTADDFTIKRFDKNR